MKREESGHGSAASSRRFKWRWDWLIPVLAIPLLLPLFLGDVLAAPFVARRHESTLRWLMFMTARFLVPAMIVGGAIGYLIKRSM